MATLVKKYRLVDDVWKHTVVNILDAAIASKKEPKVVIKFLSLIHI